MGARGKPVCLGPEYAPQFHEDAVALAYRDRPPHPVDVISLVASLQPSGPGHALDLGCGTGDLTIPFAGHTRHVDAVDPSQAMLRLAQRRPGGNSARIFWHCAKAEDFDYVSSYDLVVAADSLHWMDLGVVVPKIASVLRPDAYLAIVGRSRSSPAALRAVLDQLIPRYSTNQHYEPYDTVQLLKDMDLFEEVGRQEFVALFEQSVDDFVGSIHSQNGFSRDRMTHQAACDFDAQVRDAATLHATVGSLRVEIIGSVVWSHPIGDVGVR